MGWWWRMGCMALVCAVAPPLAALTKPRNPIPIPAQAFVLLDADSGRVLEERNADAPLGGGSLGHLMLLLLSLEQAELGGLPIDVPVTIGPQASSGPGPERGSPDGGARVHLQADEAYLLSDLLKAMIITSAPDAAIAVAEAIAGSVPACLDLMNARAERLGLKSTVYTSIGGIRPEPSTSPDMISARSLATLAQTLVQHPAVLEWASLTGLPFHNGRVLLRNANQLLGKVEGVDGLQVALEDGTNAGIVATGQRNGLRLIAVVLGAANRETSYAMTTELLERGFAQYERVDVIRQGDRVNFSIRIDDGPVAQVTPIAGRTLSLLRRRGEEPHLEVYYQVPGALRAPLKRDEAIGELVVKEDGEVVGVVPLLSSESVPFAGMLTAVR